MPARQVLDFGCGAGGAGTGYHRAGFVPVGVDTVPQPRYPFEFIQADALEVADSLARTGRWRHLRAGQFSLFHASMPCQRWSRQLSCRPGDNERWPDLITPLRPLLAALGPYIMENVEGSPLASPVTLCGRMFGREHYRHRLLESPLPLPQPPHPGHAVRASKAGHWEPGTYISVAGHCSPMWLARQVMDIDWMRRDELTEAVPPYFTEWAGHHAQALLSLAA